MNRFFRTTVFLACFAFLAPCSFAAGINHSQILTKRIPASRLVSPGQQATPATLGPVYWVIHQLWNIWDGTWDNISMSTYKYNAYGDVSEEATYNWAAGWQPDLLIKTYKALRMVPDSSRTTKYVEGTGWFDYAASTQTFSRVGAPLLYRQKNNFKLLGITDKFGDTLHDSTLVQDIWKTNGYIDSEIVRSINLQIDTNGGLVNDIKFYVHFNNRNQNDMQRVYLWVQLPDSTFYQWVDVVEHYFTYDTRGNRTQWTTLFKEPGTTAYVNYKQESYHYTTTNLVDTMVIKMWADSVWELTEKTAYAYNPLNNILTEMTSIMGDTSWMNSEKNDYVYDTGDSLLLRKTTMSWYSDGIVNEWRNEKRDLYSYSPVGTVPAARRSTTPVSLACVNRPGSTVFSFSVASPSKVSLAVYDLRGNVVKQLVQNSTLCGDQRVIWDRSARIAKGTYVCRLTTRNGSLSRRIVIVE